MALLLQGIPLLIHQWQAPLCNRWHFNDWEQRQLPTFSDSFNDWDQHQLPTSSDSFK
jgi:hypothetical protein